MSHRDRMPDTSKAAVPGYMTGFANEFATEALAGSLPAGRNSPQKPARGLYVEKFSGTAFTAPAKVNYRSWFYRIRPSVVHGNFRRIDAGLIRTAPVEDAPVTPNQLCWNPQPIPEAPTDFVQGLMTVAGNGDARVQAGIGIHVYCANRSMEDRFFYDADGELLIVPQQGGLRLHTECGVLAAGPGEIAIVPRGMKFRVVLGDDAARGWICENYGRKLELPERGPIGSDGLANRRDFETPVAAYEDREGELELVAKYAGKLFTCRIGHSPLDVVAWHGNLAPCRYDLRRFNTIGSISYDHPDPSIFTVLTSPSDTAGTANVDLAIFPPRWLVTEATFRPPWFHRNVMSEYMGLIYGEYDAKKGGALVPGGATLHNCMSAHGPDRASWEQASRAELVPQKIDDTMAFMFESRYPIQPTRFALESGTRRSDYRAAWQDLPKTFSP